MTDAELKKIHGKDVELAPDDSEDEKLTEKQALAQAKKEGIEFIDDFVVVPVGVTDPSEGVKFSTLESADKAIAKKKNPKEWSVIQVRYRTGE